MILIYLKKNTLRPSFSLDDCWKGKIHFRLHWIYIGLLKQLIEIVETSIKSNHHISFGFQLFREGCMSEERREYFAIIMRTLWIVVVILLEIHLYFTGEFRFVKRRNFVRPLSCNIYVHIIWRLEYTIIEWAKKNLKEPQFSKKKKSLTRLH